MSAETALLWARQQLHRIPDLDSRRWTDVQFEASPHPREPGETKYVLVRDAQGVTQPILCEFMMAHAFVVLMRFKTSPESYLIPRAAIRGGSPRPFGANDNYLLDGEYRDETE